MWLGQRNRGTEYKALHRGGTVIRTPVDIPFKARKVRIYPTRYEAEDRDLNTVDPYSDIKNYHISLMRFEVFV